MSSSAAMGIARLAGAATRKQGAPKPLFERYKFLPLAEPEKYGGSYLKNALAEIPEALVASLYACVGIGIIFYKLRVESKTGKYSNRPYKNYNTIMRSDDPRVKRIKSEFYEKSHYKDGNAS